MLAEINANRLTLCELVRSIHDAMVPFLLVVCGLRCPVGLALCAAFPFWLCYAYQRSDFFGRPFLVRAIHDFLEKQHALSTFEQADKYGHIVKLYKMNINRV
jgi:hypothetical protein